MNSGDSLYQDAIKKFAQAAHGHGTLENASGEAKLNNPLCGDRVRMQVALDAGRIVAVAHETKGCLLCRAAASLLGARAPTLAGTAACCCRFAPCRRPWGKPALALRRHPPETTVASTDNSVRAPN